MQKTRTESTLQRESFTWELRIVREYEYALVSRDAGTEFPLSRLRRKGERQGIGFENLDHRYNFDSCLPSMNRIRALRLGVPLEDDFKDSLKFGRANSYVGRHRI